MPFFFLTFSWMTHAETMKFEIAQNATMFTQISTSIVHFFSFSSLKIPLAFTCCSYSSLPRLDFFNDRTTSYSRIKKNSIFTRSLSFSLSLSLPFSRSLAGQIWWHSEGHRFLQIRNPTQTPSRHLKYGDNRIPIEISNEMGNVISWDCPIPSCPEITLGKIYSSKGMKISKGRKHILGLLNR